MVFHTHSLGWLGEFCRKVSVVFLVLLLTPVYLSADTEIPVLTSDTQLASAGYYQLSWQPGTVGASNKNSSYELQQSVDKSFKIIKSLYIGPDHASVISGMSNGQYFYRVRKVYVDRSSSAWSNAVMVSVQHHSLYKAWAFFFAGAVVFLFTLFFIVFASKRENRD